LPSKSASTRSKAQQAEDLIEESRLAYVHRKTHREIAAHLSATRPYRISHQQVGLDLQKVEKQLREAPMVNLHEHNMRELLIIDGLQREAWDAWERSKKDRTSKGQVVKLLGLTRKERDAGSGENRETRVTITTEVGDARFLAIVFQCIEYRMRLLGLEAPKRQELTGPDGNPIWNAGSVIIELPDNNRPLYTDQSKANDESGSGPEHRD
jgi:hypothetical protein